MVVWLALQGCVKTTDRGSAIAVAVAADPTNLLRFTATAAVPATDAAFVEVWPDGADPSTGFRTTTVPGGNVALPLFGLHFDTTYDVRLDVVDAAGAPAGTSAVQTFTTGDPPAAFPSTAVTGSSADIPYLLVNMAHLVGGTPNYMYVFDGDGEVVWYQDVTVLTGNVEDFYDGYGWDPATHSIYAIVSFDRIIDQAVNGKILRDWKMGAELDHVITHEVRVWRDHVYVPVIEAFDEGGITYAADGYEVYDLDGSRLREWWLHDHGLTLDTDPPHDPPILAGSVMGPYVGARSVDWTHVNALDVDEEDGHEKVYLSLKNVSQLVKVDVDSEAIDWFLGDSGQGGTESQGDFALAGDSPVQDWFAGQHGLNLPGDGSMLLLDNGNPDARGALRAGRVLSLTVDTGAHEVTATTLATFDRSCAFRGSAYRLGNGDLLAACQNGPVVDDFDASGATKWQMAITCPPHSGGCELVRAIPVDDLGNLPNE